MLKRALLALIGAYQYLLSPWVGGSCRFWPTCSEFAREAVEAHGVARGSWLTLWRIARCQPYSAGGVDPVPASFTWRCRCSDAGGRSNPTMSGTRCDG